jgi:hypothetical protein
MQVSNEFPLRNGVVTITSTLLSQLATASTGVGPLAKRPVTDTYEYMRLGNERRALARELISTGNDCNTKGFLLETNDPAWRNIRKFLSMHSAYEL